MKFRDLKIGDTFDFINPNNYMGGNSFYKTCERISARCYRDSSGVIYKVGSINTPVYHVNNAKHYPFMVYTYDIWGNDKDGFYINDVYKTGIKIYITETDTQTEIIQMLKQKDIISKHVHNSKIDVSMDMELESPHCAIYFNWFNGKPLFELRKTSDPD